MDWRASRTLPANPRPRSGRRWRPSSPVATRTGPVRLTEQLLGKDATGLAVLGAQHCGKIQPRHRRPGDVRLQGCSQVRGKPVRAWIARRVQPGGRASVAGTSPRRRSRSGRSPGWAVLFGPRRAPGTVRACRRVPRPERLRGRSSSAAGFPGTKKHNALKTSLCVARPRRPPSSHDGPPGRRRQAVGTPCRRGEGQHRQPPHRRSATASSSSSLLAVRTVKRGGAQRSLRRSPRSTSISSSRGDGLACIGAKRSTASSHCGAARRRGRAAVRRAAARPDARVMLLAGSRGTASPPLRMELAGDGGATAFSADAGVARGPLRAAGTLGPVDPSSSGVNQRALSADAERSAGAVVRAVRRLPRVVQSGRLGGGRRDTRWRVVASVSRGRPAYSCQGLSPGLGRRGASGAWFSARQARRRKLGTEPTDRPTSSERGNHHSPLRDPAAAASRTAATAHDRVSHPHPSRQRLVATSHPRKSSPRSQPRSSCGPRPARAGRSGDAARRPASDPGRLKAPHARPRLSRRASGAAGSLRGRARGGSPRSTVAREEREHESAFTEADGLEPVELED